MPRCHSTDGQLLHLQFVQRPVDDVALELEIVATDLVCGLERDNLGMPLHENGGGVEALAVLTPPPFLSTIRTRFSYGDLPTHVRSGCQPQHTGLDRCVV